MTCPSSRFKKGTVHWDSFDIVINNNVTEILCTIYVRIDSERPSPVNYQEFIKRLTIWIASNIKISQTVVFESTSRSTEVICSFIEFSILLDNDK